MLCKKFHKPTKKRFHLIDILHRPTNLFNKEEISGAINIRVHC